MVLLLETVASSKTSIYILPNSKNLTNFRLGDVILKVNNIDCVNVPHETAVKALQMAGPVVTLVGGIYKFLKVKILVDKTAEKSKKFESITSC